MGPYHVTDIEKWLRCGYMFKLENVEHAPESHRHAKGIGGDTVHFVLEAWHKRQDELRQLLKEDFSYALDYVTRTYEKIEREGNPRYPERSDLPVFYGRDRKKEREITRDEFMAEWMEKYATMVVGYCSSPWNQDTELLETAEVELGYLLELNAAKKAKAKAYKIPGRMDLIRIHKSMRHLPAWLMHYDEQVPGSWDLLQQRLDEKGYLIELCDWKTGKDAPIVKNHRNPFVVFQRLYQHRVYALAMRDGEVGDLHREVAEDGTVNEWIENGRTIGRLPDISTWYWLPGHLPRKRGVKTPAWSGRRAKAGETPEYVPGKEPGAPMEADPRFSMVMTDRFAEAGRKDAITAMAAMRMGQFPRQPGIFSCTSCRVVRECDQDLDKPLLDRKLLKDIHLEESDYAYE